MYFSLRTTTGIWRVSARLNIRFVYYEVIIFFKYQLFSMNSITIIGFSFSSGGIMQISEYYKTVTLLFYASSRFWFHLQSLMSDSRAPAFCSALTTSHLVFVFDAYAIPQKAKSTTAKTCSPAISIWYARRQRRQGLKGKKSMTWFGIFNKTS